MKTPKISDEILINEWNNGLNGTEIAEKYNYTSPRSIRNRLKKLKDDGIISNAQQYAATGVIKRCKHSDCRFLTYLSGIYGCGYILHKHQCRPCSPENCTVYEKGKVEHKDKKSRSLKEFNYE